jgi:hypothetical protein
VLEEHLALVRQLDVTAVSTQQADAELVLEAGDRLRQRRLGDVETLGCSPEMELLGDGDEVADLA